MTPLRPFARLHAHGLVAVVLGVYVVSLGLIVAVPALPGAALAAAASGLVMGTALFEVLHRLVLLDKAVELDFPVQPMYDGPTPPAGWVPLQCERCLRAAWVPPPGAPESARIVCSRCMEARAA